MALARAEADRIVRNMMRVKERVGRGQCGCEELITTKHTIKIILSTTQHDPRVARTRCTWTCISHTFVIPKSKTQSHFFISFTPLSTRLQSLFEQRSTPRSSKSTPFSLSLSLFSLLQQWLAVGSPPRLLTPTSSDRARSSQQNISNSRNRQSLRTGILAPCSYLI